MAKIEDVNIFDLETLVNPYEAYQVLRNEAPGFLRARTQYSLRHSI